MDPEEPVDYCPGCGEPVDSRGSACSQECNDMIKLDKELRDDR